MVKSSLGPWGNNIGQRLKGNCIEVYRMGKLSSGPLAYIPHHGKFSEANARLITASPDALVAAQEAISSGRQVSSTEIAISKGAWLALREFVAATEDNFDAG